MLLGDDQGAGAFALFLLHCPGLFGQLMCPHPEAFAILKKMLMPGVIPVGGGGGGGMAPAGID